MKTTILSMIALSLLTQSSAFAVFNTFQCTSKKYKITKRLQFKETLEYQNLVNNHPVEYISIEHSSFPAETQDRGSKETFSFRLINLEGNNLYHLVITENSPESENATALLIRANDDGLVNTLMGKLTCVVQ